MKKARAKKGGALMEEIHGLPRKLQKKVIKRLLELDMINGAGLYDDLLSKLNKLTPTDNPVPEKKQRNIVADAYQDNYGEAYRAMVQNINRIQYPDLYSQYWQATQ